MENINWGSLPFGYMKTDYNIRCYYRDGKWGEIETSSSENIEMPLASTSLHYGQQAFEGLKAFTGKDGKIRIFRWQENLKRLNQSARGILMPEVTEKVFKQAILEVIRLNRKYIPPHGTGASLYIRPLLIGYGAQIGVGPATEYLFLVFVTPVGPYFKEGFKPVDMLITREFDRAAPHGTGHIKVGGNYAASLRAIKKAKELGFANVIFLDSKEQKFIDECGPANFFGIKNNTYITPKSESVLPSITNMSLMQIAESFGLKIERRPIPVEEIKTFEEVGACGTAAVISPIKTIVDDTTKEEFHFGHEPGVISTRLYRKLQAIQYGDEPDVYHWNEVLD
jgi:branched-chain amino acid aminotransferase